MADPLPFGLGYDKFRTRIGLENIDAEKDDDIYVAVVGALGAMEEYLDRKLEKIERTERFTHSAGAVMLLGAYPVDEAETITVTAVDDAAATVISYHVKADIGTLEFHSDNSIHVFEVTYTGGYADLPLPLYAALLAGFDSLYVAVSGSGVASSGAAIKSLSVPDVGTISYDTGSSSSTGSSDAPAIFGALGGLMAPFCRRWT